MVASGDGFPDVFTRLGLKQSQHIPVRSELARLYADPKRHYHNQQHLEQCINELRSCPTPDRPAIELALWFHDAIYDARRSDNEERSAELAVTHLSSLELPEDLIEDVKRLILATAHRSPPTREDEQLIVDIDLAILGQPAEIFDVYEQNIRREYAHVPEADFRAGRAAVLRRFLERPAIYHTPHFHAKYEAAARDNLTRSLRKLSL